ncbi:MAG: pacearchaeosortase [archaeon]
MKRELWNIIIRYLVLVLVAIPGFGYIYFLLSPLTVYPVAFLLNFIYAIQISGNTILLNKIALIEIIGACVAGSAYYFLLILNLAVPKVGWKKRLYMLLFAFGIFLIINILRIFILSIVYMSGSAFFDITHKIFWYLGSTLFILIIWFIEVKIFKIKQIPFYSDLKTLYERSLFKKKRYRKKK